MDAWIGLIGVLSGVAIGAIAEHFRSKAQFDREKKWEDRKDKRQRLEETYTTAEEVRQALSDAATQTALMVGLGHKPKDLKHVQLPKLAMLVNLYVPDLREDLEAVRAAHKRQSEALMSVVIHSEASKEAKGQVINEIMIALRQVNESSDRLLAHLASLADGLGPNEAPGRRRLTSA